MRLIDVNDNLDRLFNETRVFPITDADRIVVMSDFHMGNGGPRDDFARNSDLCRSVLRDYYLSRGYWLILNGDIEERQRYSAASIRGRWADMFATFTDFERGPGLTRLVGNHDEESLEKGDAIDALRLRYRDDTLFVFHSHQATLLYERHNSAVGFALRYLARPLGIGNRSVAHDRAKRFVIEKRVYEFSLRRQVASIIGHTHRPLFESLSKADSLRFKIEQLCRHYAEAPADAQRRLGATVAQLEEDLEHVERGSDPQLASLYGDPRLHLPCMFNSGCAIGRTGLTALEIVGGRIALVHWFDSTRSTKYLDYDGYAAGQLGSRPYWRVVFKDDTLSYVFTRIRLLARTEPRTGPEGSGDVPFTMLDLYG